MNRGIKTAAPRAEFLAWTWSRAVLEPDPQKNVIAKLPKDVILLSDWERGGTKEVLGETYPLDEYSFSSIGPSPRYRKQLRLAKERGMRIAAKIQIGATHEFCAVVHPRTVKGDNTVQFAGKHYLITERWKGRRPKTLQVEERFNGRLYFMHQDQSLKYRELSLEQLQAQKTPKAVSLKGKTKPAASRRAVVAPATDHPWRKYPLLLSRQGSRAGGS